MRCELSQRFFFWGGGEVTAEIEFDTLCLHRGT